MCLDTVPFQARRCDVLAGKPGRGTTRHESTQHAAREQVGALRGLAGKEAVVGAVGAVLFAWRTCLARRRSRPQSRSRQPCPNSRVDRVLVAQSHCREKNTSIQLYTSTRFSRTHGRLPRIASSMQSGVLQSVRGPTSSHLRHRQASSAFAGSAGTAAAPTFSRHRGRHGATGRAQQAVLAAAGDGAAVRRSESFKLGEDERQSVKESWEKIIRWSRLNQMCAVSPRLCATFPNSSCCSCGLIY